MKQIVGANSPGIGLHGKQTTQKGLVYSLIENIFWLMHSVI